ncbi:MAG: PDZ domain-containing protein [Bacteroidota bacterium]
MKYRVSIVLSLLTAMLCMTVSAANDGDKVVRVKAKKQGWLGVEIQDVTPKFAREHELKIKEGAFINSVVDESPADSAGLKEGDVIVEFNARKIETADDLTEAVRETAPGTKATTKIVRSGENKSIAVNVGKNKLRTSFAFGGMRMPRVMMKMSGRDVEGMELMELNKQLGEYFEAPNGKGVLVQSVDKDENAAKAGIKAGDVITKFGTETVTDAGDIRDALSDLDEGAKVNIELLRKGKKVTVSLEVSEQDNDGMMFWPGNGFEHFNFEPQQEHMEQMQRKLHDELKELPRKQKELERIQLKMGSKGV